MPKWSIETHTRLIREVKQGQIRLNPLIGLKRIKGLRGLRRLSIKSYFFNSK